MNRRKLTIIILILIAVAVAVDLYITLPKKQTNAKAEDVLSKMEQLIPNFGTDSDESSGTGRDPLAVISIDGLDIVGGLEIPSIDLRTPVTGKGSGQAYFATWDSGSPVKGNFCLIGSENNVFSRLEKCKPGDKVVFTDIDGVRYAYTVTTQFHLKSWSDADYDLMLCYQVDDDTRFVLACTSE